MKPTPSRVLLVLVLAAMAGFSAPATVSADEQNQFTALLQGCFLGVIQINKPVTDLQTHVPKPFEVFVENQPDGGWAVLWHFACDSASFDGGDAAPTNLTLLTVAIKSPTHDPTRATGVLTHVDLYDVAGFSNDPRFSSRLAGLGLAAKHEEHVRFVQTPQLPLPHVSFQIDTHDHAFGYEINPAHIDPPHVHDNAFWHERADGRFARLRTVIDSASDQSCFSFERTDCSRFWANERSRVAELVGGGSQVAFFNADHFKLESVKVTGSIVDVE